MTSFFMFNIFGVILLHFVFQCRLHRHVFCCHHVLAIKKEANKTVHPPLRDFFMSNFLFCYNFKRYFNRYFFVQFDGS